MSETKPSICFTMTSPLALRAFLPGHIRRSIRDASVAVCVNRNESDVIVDLDLGEEVEIIDVEIRRKISPVRDLLALFRLISLYRKLKFDAVITVTPKAGLLGMLAARVTGSRVRIHWFTGQVWATKTGLSRFVLKLMDGVIAGCATHLLADSASQREFLIRNRVVASSRIEVLGSGSISGVDVSRFRPDPALRSATRNELGVSQESLCLLYVGRMKREKGIPELLLAFRELRGEFPDLSLILVGPDEENLFAAANEQGLRVVGYTKEVEKYMAAADIFCLPSHREGFGSVLIEAASAGMTAVASRIYGITDAVVEGESGLLHEVGNPTDLYRCLRNLISDADLRTGMAERARLRAHREFSSVVVEEMFNTYLFELLGRSEIDAPGAVRPLAKNLCRKR